MTKFLIKYRDPQTGEDAQTEAEFSDAGGISAREWAEDYAYALADKGPHSVEEKISFLDGVVPAESYMDAVRNHPLVGDAAKPRVTTFACSPPACTSENHQWDGPVVERGRMGSISCSKCGALAFDVDTFMGGA